MSGWVYISGPCYACGQTFAYNPNHVPSIWIDPRTGLPPDVQPQPGGRQRAHREPICETCVQRANEQRVARGQEPFPVHPQAYEAEPEGSVHW